MYIFQVHLFDLPLSDCTSAGLEVLVLVGLASVLDKGNKYKVSKVNKGQEDLGMCTLSINFARMSCLSKP